jgi:hypothetical protein
MANATSKMYHKDENGTWVINDSYRNMQMMESNYTDRSWAKVIAEDVFGIDTKN